jgi:hypothetical protein
VLWSDNSTSYEGNTFSSANTSVATISGAAGTATITGVGAGSTNVYSDITTIVDSQGDPGPMRAQAQTKVMPQVTLTVSTTGFHLGQQGQTGQFYANATVTGGFTGTISGTITISQPVNGNSILLDQGGSAQSYSFTLTPGGSTSNTCSAPSVNCFTVMTDPANPNTGTLTYTVSVDPSSQFAVNGSSSPKQVVVTVP